LQVYVIFAHPSKESFTHKVLESFLHGLRDAGHSFEIGDLYAMNFKSELDLPEYKRETGLNPDAEVPLDVKTEQEKISKADALVFIYPVWWSDCPAKLKGWFDRVFTYGYAYQYVNGEHFTSKIKIEKALVLSPAGHTNEHLEEIGIAEGMRCIMLKDRLLGVGVKQARMEILGGTTGGDHNLRQKHLTRAYQLGKTF
jgi:NAD(P)H dehydrogenase (quinone)